MQSVVSRVGKTGALLFVRSVDDVSAAVRAVNEILSRRRPHGWPDHEVLGILVGEGADASLEEPEDGDARRARVDLTLRESVALSGIWSLCRFDLGSVEVCRHAGDRRRRLLDNLLPGLQNDQTAATGQPVFLPALTPFEAGQDADVLFEDLERRYPALAIGRDCFVGDPARGGLVAFEGHDMPLRRQRLS